MRASTLSSLLPALLLPVFLLSACAEGGEGGGGGTTIPSNGDSGSGASLYAANCSGCHGASAQGGSGPNIAGISDSNGVIDTILNGTEGMPGFASSLSDQDISDIIAYLQTLSGGNGGGGDD